jgi:hypothetical protein
MGIISHLMKSWLSLIRLMHTRALQGLLNHEISIKDREGVSHKTDLQSVLGDKVVIQLPLPIQ